MTEWEDQLETLIRGGVGCFTPLWSGSSPSASDAPRHDDAVVITLAGELDLAVSETLRAALRQAMGYPRLIVDLSAVTFIDSSGLHTILDAYKHCRDGGPTLIIRPGPPNVQRVFELTNTLDFLPFERGT